jgi:HIRAN domain
VAPIDLNDGWPRVPPRPLLLELSAAERSALPFESDACPSCGIQVMALPKGTKRCKACGEQMHVVVIDGATRRLVNGADQQRINQANASRADAEYDAAELAWFEGLRRLGLHLGEMPGIGETIAVVGESHYLETLANIMAALKVSEHDREVDAVAKLVREPDNRYDRNAVKVEVHGRLVGHLSREDAEDIQRWIQQAERAGPVLVLARLGGGVLDAGRVGPIGVTLEDLPAVFG